MEYIDNDPENEQDFNQFDDDEEYMDDEEQKEEKENYETHNPNLPSYCM